MSYNATIPDLCTVGLIVFQEQDLARSLIHCWSGARINLWLLFTESIPSLSCVSPLLSSPQTSPLSLVVGLYAATMATITLQLRDLWLLLSADSRKLQGVESVLLQTSVCFAVLCTLNMHLKCVAVSPLVVWEPAPEMDIEEEELQKCRNLICSSQSGALNEANEVPVNC